MPTPAEFMRQYRNIKVDVAIDDPVTRTCRVSSNFVQLRKYFMMDWSDGTEERRDYNEVIAAPATIDGSRRTRSAFERQRWAKGPRKTISSRWNGPCGPGRCHREPGDVTDIL